MRAIIQTSIVCMCACVGTILCEGEWDLMYTQRPEITLRCSSGQLPTLVLESRSLTRTWGFPIRVGWDCPVSACTVPGFWVCTTICGLFYMDSESQTQFSCSPGKYFMEYTIYSLHRLYSLMSDKIFSTSTEVWDIIIVLVGYYFQRRWWFMKNCG